MLKAMIASGDFQFKETVRLWRLPASRSGGSVSPRLRKNYNFAHYQVVCGRIAEIATEKNGVRYFGGPRYTISWEDGLVEKALTATELLQLYRNTPQSLGCSTVLDIKLTDELLNLGLKAGIVLENQHRIDAVNGLRTALKNPILKEEWMVRETFEAVLLIAFGIREVMLVGIPDNKTNNSDPIRLQSKMPPLRSKLKGAKLTLKDVISICKSPSTWSNDTVVLPRSAPKRGGRGGTDNPFEPETTDRAVVVKDDVVEWVSYRLSVPPGYRLKGSAACNDHYLVMQRTTHPHSPSGNLDVRCYEAMAHYLSRALQDSHGKNSRRQTRLALVRAIETAAPGWLEEGGEAHLSQRVVEEIGSVLPGCCIYLALLVRDEGHKPDMLKYIASNSYSTMRDKTLLRGEGLSFDVMELRKSVVLQQSDLNKRKLLGPDSVVDVLYGKVKFRGKVVKDR
eukprot:gene3535-4393_t